MGADLVFFPVLTLTDLDSLDADDMVRGYTEARRGDSQPGHNQGRAYWHGWRCRMMDWGEIPSDAGHRNLTRLVVARSRARRMSDRTGFPPESAA